MNHSFIESLFYLPMLIGGMTALFGVHPVIMIVVSLIDVLYGTLLHLSDDLVTFKYGFLEKFMQTPSYHRVHHAKNLTYMDMNFNSITLFWDWVLGTRIELDDEEPVEYGITRDVSTVSLPGRPLRRVRRPLAGHPILRSLVRPTPVPRPAPGLVPRGRRPDRRSSEGAGRGRARRIGHLA